ncbi:MAG: hypothetical protein K2N13_01925 [Paraprevotella sp.]|nr:hypothetical protein [Paraprevotella sp.]
MNKFFFLLCISAIFSTSVLHAQETFDEYRKRINKEFKEHKQRVEQDFDAYRKKVNADFAEYMRKTWVKVAPKPKVPQPKEDQPIPPVIFEKEKDDKPIQNNQKPIEEVIPIPKPEPQPEPIAPIEEKEKEQEKNLHSLTYMGNNIKVRIPQNYRFILRNNSENTVANAWKDLSEGSFDNTLIDLLNLRKTYRLCDWAYLNLLKTFSYGLLGERSNEATLLTAYLYTQSGYMMRLAQSGNRLCMLFGSKFLLFDKPYYSLDGYYYYNMDKDESNLNICKIKFPKEQAFSLYITQEQVVPQTDNYVRTLQAKAYPSMRFTIHTNKHLIDFYNTYPTGKIGSNVCTRWAVYANTPLNSQTRDRLYPALKNVLSGKSQADALNMLLNFVQTSLVYEYDDKVWGRDRAFFSEETLYYPYADCEDRAILFTRLVRDLLHLKTALVYYPGHLACAVKVTDPNIKGDFLIINGARYLICDPTYINAPIGWTMPDMDNNKAKVIQLD